MLGQQGPAFTQDLHSPSPEELINSTERVAVEQIDALISAQQFSDAVSQLQRLKDLPPKLIERGPMQSAATQHVQTYQRLSRWCQQKLQGALSTHSESRQAFNDQWSAIADVALATALPSHDSAQVSSAIDRYRNTPAGDKLALMHADLLIERGDVLAAVQSLDGNFPHLLRVPLHKVVPGSFATEALWSDAWWAAQQDAKLKERLLELWRNEVAGLGEPMVVQVLSRLLIATAIHPQLFNRSVIESWVKSVAVTVNDAHLRTRLLETIDESSKWNQPDRIASTRDARLFSLDRHPNWQVQLDRWPNGSDLTPASKPAVGQLNNSLPYAPVIHDGKVFLHELTKITARDLSNGKSWPDGSSSIALFDSHINPTSYLPLGYPLQGTPKPKMTISGDCLYARMGSPVTAWYNRSHSDDGGSLSYLVGLDLNRQGSLLRGFPLQLTEPLFSNAEFEGTPVVVGDQLVVAIAQRDNVSIRRSLAAFDRFSGQLRWQTKTLGAGSVVGSDRANLIAATQPTAVGGLLYYQTDLGSIACIEANSGSTIWLTRYNREHRLQRDFPRPHRYRYRDGNACIVQHGTVYCLPQDCPELIALDALNGDVRWATNEDDVADCTYMLGTCENSLIVGGDRLVWLDTQYGTVQSQFPTRATPGIVNALAQPRGLGRGALVVDRVYWPTAAEILVFRGAAQTVHGPGIVPSACPVSLSQMSTSHCGSEGGNVVAAGPWLLLATPGRLACFQSSP